MNDPGALAAIADRYGTPLYVYDLDAIAGRAAALRAVLPPRVELAYAVKANPSLAVLARLATVGVGADVASAGELAAACRAGFAPESIVFTGPGKREAELDRGVRSGLRAITVESLGELERLASIARREGRRVPVLLRAAGGRRRGNVVGSGHGRFGMRRPDLVMAAGLARDHDDLDLVGIHRFDASNVLDAGALVEGARRTLRLAGRLARLVGMRLSLVDIGGGLGVPYADGDEPLDIDRLGSGLAALLAEADADPWLTGARLLLEPGRWLVAPAGVYLTRVIDVKEGSEGTVATVDGGIHHLLRPALVGQPHAIRSLAADAGSRMARPTVVGGPLCTALDVLGRAMLPDPRPGDLLAVSNAGAYGFSESMPYFLSHPMAAEVAVSGGRDYLVRPRLDPEEILDRQRLPRSLTRPAAAS